MRRSVVSFGLLVMLAACGSPSSAALLAPVPTSTSEHGDSLSTLLDGVWDVADPPIEVTFQLDVRKVIIEHKGLPIKQTWPLFTEREDVDAVYLRGPSTSGGGAIIVRFLSEDVVQWHGLRQKTRWILTRKP